METGETIFLASVQSWSWVRLHACWALLRPFKPASSALKWPSFLALVTIQGSDGHSAEVLCMHEGSAQA